jgi:multicomponent Na+:H+ antiporter subunit D
MILGLALYAPLAIIGAVFYLVHHIVVKANLFLISGVANRIAGSTDLTRIGGLYKSAPLLAFLFLIPAFSLAGFPPLSGFWAKLVVVRAALEAEAWILAAAALVTGALTIYSMTKIWGEAFWKPHPDGIEPSLSMLPLRVRIAMVSPIAALAALTVLVGLMPEPFMVLAERAAQQLLEPDLYIATVLEAGGAGRAADSGALDLAEVAR